MKRNITFVLTLAAGLALLSLGATAFAGQNSPGKAAAFPWAFTKGTSTARQTAYATVEQIVKKGGYAQVPRTVAAKAWKGIGSSKPTKAALKRFADKLKVSKVLYGKVSWHTRSIWVGTGPKTISTATATVYVYDARTGKVIYSKKYVTGRSDEKENGLKIVADVLLTPIVTAVSGGPATPREQRAAQIAIARAYHGWVKKHK